MRIAYSLYLLVALLSLQSINSEVYFYGKLAFLFLVKDNLNVPDVWNEYFSNAPRNFFSIYYL